MALGTTLSGTLDVSTTLGLQSLTFTSDGRAVVQSLIDSGGSLTLCVMGYYFDYLGNEPVAGGDHTQILIYYGESSGAQRPALIVQEIGGPIISVYSETTGNDDDAYLHKYGQTDDWATLRGDVDTVANVRYDSSTYYSYAVTNLVFPGKGGGDPYRDIRRSYFVFDLSGISGATADVVQLRLRCDNLGHTNDDLGKIIAVQATALAGTTADYGNCFVADAVTVTDNATFFGANF